MREDKETVKLLTAAFVATASAFWNIISIVSGISAAPAIHLMYLGMFQS